MNDAEKRFSEIIGEEYDLFKLSLPHLDEIEKFSVKKLSDHFENGESAKVLEIGFGTGITTKLLLDDKKINLVAIDNEPHMLDQARKKLTGIDNNRYELIIADALDYLKIQPDSSFDGVISVWVLHNIVKDSRNIILKEIYRVIKPDGVFVNGDKIAVDDQAEHSKHLEWQIKQFDVYDTTDTPHLKQEWTKHYMEDEKPERILVEKEYIDGLSKIGFKDIKTEDRHYLDAVSSAIK
jgi:ubiquinone/menaquinone biosynthesis C-methylase UbiE